MANVQRPGFFPLRRTDGSRITMQRRRVLSNNTNAISLYDALIHDSNGDTIRATATDTAVLGSANGVSYVPNGTSNRINAKSLPAATTYSGSAASGAAAYPENASFVFTPEDNVSLRYLASVDEAIGHTDLGLNYLMILGSASNGISGHELDATSRAATGTLPWRVHDFWKAPTGLNDTSLADAAVECSVNAGFAEPALTLRSGT